MSNQYVGISRNQPCPCGSGMRFKQCHGLIATGKVEAPTETPPFQQEALPNETEYFLQVLASGLYDLDSSIDGSDGSFMAFVKKRIQIAQQDPEYFFTEIGNVIGVRKALKDAFGNGTTNIQGSPELLTRAYAAFSVINTQLQGYQRIILNDLIVDGFIQPEDVDPESLRSFGTDYADQIDHHLNDKLNDRATLFDIGKKFMFANRDYLLQ